MIFQEVSPTEECKSTSASNLANSLPRSFLFAILLQTRDVQFVHSKNKILREFGRNEAEKWIAAKTRESIFVLFSPTVSQSQMLMHQRLIARNTNDKEFQRTEEHKLISMNIWRSKIHQLVSPGIRV
jgi:hypothetical protein